MLCKKEYPASAFLYMVETDEKGGHDNGWVSEEYLKRKSIAIDIAPTIARLMDIAPDREWKDMSII